MLVPALQHGEWRDVRKRVTTAVRRIMSGESIIDVVAEGGMLDTATTDGLMVVSGTLRAGVGIYCHEPWKHLLDAIAVRDDPRSGRELEERVFRASIAVPWGVLGLMSPGCTLWFTGHRDWDEPFLHAALAAWDEIDAVGARYYQASRGECMWALPNGLKHVLARAGVPGERLREPLPPGGPAALMKYARLAS